MTTRGLRHHKCAAAGVGVDAYEAVGEGGGGAGAGAAACAGSAARAADLDDVDADNARALEARALFIYEGSTYVVLHDFKVASGALFGTVRGYKRSSPHVSDTMRRGVRIVPLSTVFSLIDAQPLYNGMSAERAKIMTAELSNPDYDQKGPRAILHTCRPSDMTP